MTEAPELRADRLNRDCHCTRMDTTRLARALGLDADAPDGFAALRQSHPHLFSDTAVFIASAQLARMAAVIGAIERVVALPSWQTTVLARGPAAARVTTATRGMFTGYDFHLGQGGPQLIEVNTNAGGALLNVALREAQSACCGELGDTPGGTGAVGNGDIAGRFVAMLREEWRLARGERPLGTVAIVDDVPASQFLYPEFRRFVGLCRAHGIDARIADAASLVVRDGELRDGSTRIDFVYNRLTDFDLSEPRHAALAEAWGGDLAVISPHPRAHALYADKRNLVTLTDAAALAALGVDAQTIAQLAAGIPRTLMVTPANAVDLWETRRRWFFKPAAGYGSKATYRGDKLTRGKWEEILAAGDYVAQALVPPGERQILVDGEPRALKMDIRNYVYAGEVQLVCARLYQGQTTNFRTPGGGFAPVFEVPPG